jgi:phosphoribosylglycinamide formyltransferase-1
MSEPLRVGVLASGRGSNFRALAEAAASGRIPAAVVVLVTDRAEAGALAIARELGIEAVVLPPGQHPSREAHEKAVVAALEERRVGLVCLAGYLRLVSPAFVAHPGLHPQRQALEHGARVSGATVHFVDDGVDTGPIVLQAAVPVLPDDTEATLADRILAEEHRLYPEAVRLFVRGRLEIRGRRVQIRGTP